jgi:hypothetical protein
LLITGADNSNVAPRWCADITDKILTKGQRFPNGGMRQPRSQPVFLASSMLMEHIRAIRLESQMPVTGNESCGLGSIDYYNTLNIVERGCYMKKIRLKFLSAFIVSASIFGIYHNALAEIRTMKIKIPSCL